ncbi:hypothetical protein O9992_07035 [Vibrio lentus]|nr:hypothetical protein [Vibrio lentus]
MASRCDAQRHSTACSGQEAEGNISGSIVTSGELTEAGGYD